MAATVSHDMEVRFEASIPAAYLFKWKVRPGSKVSQGTILLLYDERRPSEADVGSLKKMKATAVGTVSELLKTEGDAMLRGCPVLIMKGCSHPIVMKDMCAECGADLREFGRQSELRGGKASVAMVHSIPELMVSQEQAQVLGKADETRLLKHKKLVLLVDLDQTLIHTTNDDIPANLKDVHHFQLYGGQSPWYHARLRPGTKEFLEKVSKKFELHICTFGARTYAHTIAGFLDKDGRYFSHRILSRDECFNPSSKTANLSALFPCGDHLVCIIDDREDVWNYAPNLVHVKPYHFFQHTGDINAPPGLSKNDGDSEDKSKFLVGRKLKRFKPRDGSLKKPEEDGVKKPEDNSGKVKEEPGVDAEGRTTKLPLMQPLLEIAAKDSLVESSATSISAAEEGNGNGDDDVKTKQILEALSSDLLSASSDVVEEAKVAAEEGHEDSSSKPKLCSEALPSSEVTEEVTEEVPGEVSGEVPGEVVNKAPEDTSTKSEQTENNNVESTLSSERSSSVKDSETPHTESPPLRGEDKTASNEADDTSESMDVGAASSDVNSASTALGNPEDQALRDSVQKPRQPSVELPSSEIVETLRTVDITTSSLPDITSAPMDVDPSSSSGDCTATTQAPSPDATAASVNLPAKDSSAEAPILSENGVSGAGDVESKRGADLKKTEAASVDRKKEEVDEDLMDVEDDDDYLLYLSEILENIHRAFYETHAKQGEIPDLKKVIPQVRRKVLRGVRMVFSGIIPTNVPLEKSRAYHVARSLGAEIQPNLVLRTRDNKQQATTHVVAARLGTIKVNEAKRCRSIHVITPDWLWCCSDRWEWVSEQMFPLTKESAIDQKQAGAPEVSRSSRQKSLADPALPRPVLPPLDVFPTYDPVTGKRVNKTLPSAASLNAAPGGKGSLSAASTSGASSSSSKLDAKPDFATSFNPLMSFSSEDIASMDQEVEDLLDSPDTDEETSADVPEKASAKDPPSSSSSSSCSLGAERPHGWGRATRKRKMEEEAEKEQDTESDGEGEYERPKYPRCELPRDSERSDSERDSDEFQDSVGSVDEEMAAAVEREFLGF